MVALPHRMPHVAADELLMQLGRHGSLPHTGANPDQEHLDGRDLGPARLTRP